MIRLTVPEIGEEEIAAVSGVLRSGQLVHGPECERLERELAEYLGAADVVVVSSGTAALHLSLAALGIGPGDAVLVPDFTFPATANVVELVGARPLLVDVAPETYNAVPDAMERVIANWRGPERIRALMPVHEFGCPVDMTAVMRIAADHALTVVEDAACALGARHGDHMVGTIGDLGCYSFHPRKAMTTGEGGAIAVRDPGTARRLRQLRSHGMQVTDRGTQFLTTGYNYRLTNIQAALGRAQLRKFPGWLRARRQLQAQYRRALESLPGIALPAEVDGHAWQTFMVVLADGVQRDRVIASLRDQGIESNLGAHAVHAQPYYADKYPEMAAELASGTSRRLFKQGLALPFFASLGANDVERVAAALRAAVAGSADGCRSFS